jgi:release factor glutamine methyltransferase
MNDIWTVRRVLGWTAEHFQKRGVDAPRLTAEILLAHLLAASRVQLYIDLDRPLSKMELAEYRALIERRLGGEPTQYVTGTREFFGRPFAVDPRALIPRPETELLVEKALGAVAEDANCRALDLCTGSGCIAASLAAERPGVRVVATDISADACELARANAAALKVSDRVQVLQGDLFEALSAGSCFDLVACNPPYISWEEMESLAPEVLREPRVALDGGRDGLEIIRRVARESLRWLAPGGLLAMEIGERQGPPALSLLQENGFVRCGIEKDFSKLDRLAVGYKP